MTEFSHIFSILLDRGDVDGAASVQRARTVRNACAGVVDNAAHALDHGVLPWLRQYCQDVALSASKLSAEENGDSSDASAATRKQFVTATLQFLSNYAACGPRFARSLWNSADTPLPPFGEVGFRNVLAAAVTVGSRPATAAAVSAMFNSFKQMDDDDDADDQEVGAGEGGACLGAALDAFCTSRGLCAQLLLAVPDTAAAVLATAGEQTDGVGGAADPVSEWVHLLFVFLLRRGRAAQVFTTLQPRAAGDSVWDCVAARVALPAAPPSPAVAAMTHEQVILMQVLQDVFEDAAAMNGLVDEATRRGSGFDGVGQLLRAVADTVGRLHRTDTDTDTDEAVKDASDAPVSPLPLLLLCLNAVGTAVAWLPRGAGRAVRSSLATTTPLMRVCVDWLRRDDARKRALADARRSQKDSVSSSSLAAAPAGASQPRPRTSAPAEPDKDDLAVQNEIVKACLQVLGNLCFDCPAAQDLMSPDGGDGGAPLATVLSHCATDFDNPLSREWALMCVRNACEGHARNQRFIDALRPQQVLQDDALQASGIRVEIDPATGRFAYHQEDPSQRPPT
jgi:hypothetical protein